MLCGEIQLDKEKYSVFVSQKGGEVVSVAKHQILALCRAVGAVSSGCQTLMEIVFRSLFKLAKS